MLGPKSWNCHAKEESASVRAARMFCAALGSQSDNDFISFRYQCKTAQLREDLAGHSTAAIPFTNVMLENSYLSLSLQQKAAVPLQGKPTRAGSRRAAPSLTFPEHLHANHTVDLEGTLKCHLVQLPSSKQGQSHAGYDPHGLKTHELITALTGYLCL